MMARRRLIVGSAMMAVFAVCRGGFTQTIAVGTVSRDRGATVTVPVTLTASTSHTAVLVRLNYNSSILGSPSVARGPLLSPSHTLASFSPAPGRFNVAVYADSGMPSFTAKSGALFTLSFYVKPTAPYGVSPITFTTVGTPALPASDLTDILCCVAAHTTQAGSVSVGAAGVTGPWLLYR
jgi:hypothetical protein